MTTTTNTLILGGGQAGLALSQCLTVRGHDHLVLERGQVAERWRSERWNSLRLLTPNWMTRLPGWTYDGHDPDGFMTASEVATFFARYAASFAAPVVEGTTVQQVIPRGDRFAVTTDQGPFAADNVVIATGWCDRPAVPAVGRQLSPHIYQIVPSAYRGPDDLPSGGVLVVGASATGVQLADELRSSGRDVTIAVGSHGRLPRSYRGMDIFWWLEAIGTFDRTVDDLVVGAHREQELRAARSEPSVQLVGRPDNETLDLARLAGAGVGIVGRVLTADGTRLGLAPEADAVVAAADEQMERVLDRIDQYVAASGLETEVLAPSRPRHFRTGPVPDVLDLDARRITTVVWATGYRRPYEWLDIPVLDAYGEVRQYRGVTPVPGVYVLGQKFQHYRNSSFIDGVGRDATYIADHITACASTHSPLNVQKRA